MPSYRGEEWIGHALAIDRRRGGRWTRAADDRRQPDAGGPPDRRGFRGSRSPARDCARGSGKLARQGQFRRRRLAQSTHVCLLCVDDVWLPGRAATVRSWIDAAPRAVLHLAPTTIIDRLGRELGIWRCPLPTRASSHSRRWRNGCWFRISSPHPHRVPPGCVDRCGGLDDNLWYTADWDIWLKLPPPVRSTTTPEITTGFRIHRGSLTMTGSRNSAEVNSRCAAFWKDTFRAWSALAIRRARGTRFDRGQFRPGFGGRGIPRVVGSAGQRSAAAAGRYPPISSRHSPARTGGAQGPRAYAGIASDGLQPLDLDEPEQEGAEYDLRAQCEHGHGWYRDAHDLPGTRPPNDVCPHRTTA